MSHSLWYMFVVLWVLWFSSSSHTPQQCSESGKTDTSSLDSLLISQNAGNMLHFSLSLARGKPQVRLLFIKPNCTGCSKVLPPHLLCSQQSPGIKTMLILQMLWMKPDRNQSFRQPFKEPAHSMFHFPSQGGSLKLYTWSHWAVSATANSSMIFVLSGPQVPNDARSISTLNEMRQKPVPQSTLQKARILDACSTLLSPL